KGDGPSLIECMTYRTSGHSRADPGKYRPPGELDAWKERDPIKLYRERLLQFGIGEAAIIDNEKEVRHAVDEASEAWNNAPSTDPAIITADVYADGSWAWRN